MVRKGWTVLAIAASAWGCGDDATVVTEMTDEGPVVSNLSSANEVSGARLGPLWTHRSENWVDPEWVGLSGTGLVGVADPEPGRMHVLGSEGREAEAWGEVGEGPGQWSGVSGAVFGGDRFVVQPSAAQYLEVFDATGEPEARIELGQPIRLAAVTDSVVVGRSSTRESVLVVASLHGEHAVREIAVPTTDRYPEEEYGSCWRLAASAEGFFRSSCAAGRIQVLDPAGAHRHWIELADEPRSSTTEEMDRYAERVWHELSGGRELTPIVARQMEAVRTGVEIRPKYAALRVDPATGRFLLLEQPYGDYGDQEGVLHLVSPEGEHERRIETGLRIRDVAILGDTVALLTRDPATDLVSLEVHVIEEEEGGS